MNVCKSQQYDRSFGNSKSAKRIRYDSGADRGLCDYKTGIHQANDNYFQEEKKNLRQCLNEAKSGSAKSKTSGALFNEIPIKSKQNLQNAIGKAYNHRFSESEAHLDSSYTAKANSRNIADYNRDDGRKGILKRKESTGFIDDMKDNIQKQLKRVQKLRERSDYDISDSENASKSIEKQHQSNTYSFEKLEDAIKNEENFKFEDRRRSRTPLKSQAEPEPAAIEGSIYRNRGISNKLNKISDSKYSFDRSFDDNGTEERARTTGANQETFDKGFSGKPLDSTKGENSKSYFLYKGLQSREDGLYQETNAYQSAQARRSFSSSAIKREDSDPFNANSAAFAKTYKKDERKEISEKDSFINKYKDLYQEQSNENFSTAKKNSSRRHHSEYGTIGEKWDRRLSRDFERANEILGGKQNASKILEKNKFDSAFDKIKENQEKLDKLIKASQKGKGLDMEALADTIMDAAQFVNKFYREIGELNGKINEAVLLMKSHGYQRDR